jgi:secreted trypsin-like serine protease
MKLSRGAPILAGVLISFAGAVPALADVPPPEPVQPMIIDGQPADSGPWAARLFSQGREMCSATIIAPTWVLTAEHCVSNGDLSFRIGHVDHSQGEQAEQLPDGVHTHPSADLALVEIDHAVETEYAPLGESGAVAVGDQVQIYGWGATCTDRPEAECQSPHLKVANVEVYEVNNSCTDYRGALAVCGQRGDGIAAGGDSGGPMFAGDVQVGVASTSDRQSKTQYTNVTEYRDWIKQVSGV